MDYIDFVLKISPGKVENQYAVEAQSALTGQVTGTFTSPFTAEQLELFVLRLGTRSSGKRRLRSPEWEAAQAFGEKLFNAVFNDNVRDAFTTCSNDALRQRQGLRLKLILDAPALVDYPWEFLYDASNAQFLALFENTPLVRFLELPEPIPPLAVNPPLRILAGAASPRDYEPLDIEQEQRNLMQALDPLLSAGQVALDWLPHLTLEALRQQLLKHEYHVFHFSGHGGFDSAQQDGLLVLEDERGQSNAVSGERFAVVLGNHRSLRLAVLNACEGARTSPQDPFAGTATTLVRTGDLPAVLAMQFAISDSAAIDFARGFYGALTAGRPIDAAVAQGRQAIFTANNDIEWATPVLYLRAPDGRIFALQAPPVVPTALQPKQPVTATVAPAPAPLPAAPKILPERAAPVRAPAVASTPTRRNSPLLWLGTAALVLCIGGSVLASRFLPSGVSAPSPTPPAFIPVPTVLQATDVPFAETNTPIAKSSGDGVATPVPAIFPTKVPTPEPELLSTVNLSANPGRSRYPQILIDGAGVVHVVWTDKTPNPTTGTPSILHRQLQLDGTWSPAEILYDGSGYAVDSSLRVINDRVGHACIYWIDSNPKTYLRCQKNGKWSEVTVLSGNNTLAYAPDGSVQALRLVPNKLFFGNQQISDPFSSVVVPQFVIDPRGVYHVAWARIGKNPYQSIEYRSSSDGGKTWSEQMRLSDDNANSNERLRMIGDAQGNLHLVWKADGRFMYRRWTPAQGWSDAVDIRASAEGGNLIGLAVDAQFKPHVIWQSSGIHYTHQNQDETWSFPLKFTNPTVADLLASNLAVGTDGTRYFAWYDGKSDDIFFARLAPE